MLYGVNRNLKEEIFMIEIVDVHKSYDNGPAKVSVLNGLNLSVEAGKVVSIFGHSGSGKSTLLHILGGLDTPTSGRVLIGGTDVYKISEGKRSVLRNKKIGFVFQFYHLLSEFSALENVAIPVLSGGNVSWKDAFSKAKRLLGEFGLGDRLHHKPSELSGGQQQRVAIARALVNDADIILCDEPTGNLDYQTTSVVLNFIRDLNKISGKTFVIVTHEKEIAQMADVTYYLRDGRLC